MSKVYLCAIALNEAEFAERWLRQHYDWPDRIIIVHGADRHFPADQVSATGLSLDATEDIIRSFPDPSKKITLVNHGWAGNTSEPGSGKVELRDRYAQMCDEHGYLLHLDLDEFYTRRDQQDILRELFGSQFLALQVPQVHFWKGPDRIIQGGYADIGHFRFFRWHPGYRYERRGDLAAHNFPRDHEGRYLQRVSRHSIKSRILNSKNGCDHVGPCCFHMGFARSPETIRAKNKYYRDRGEDKDRPQTLAFRESWFSEQPPTGCSVYRWIGRLPEVFENERVSQYRANNAG